MKKGNIGEFGLKYFLFITCTRFTSTLTPTPNELGSTFYVFNHVAAV